MADMRAAIDMCAVDYDSGSASIHSLVACAIMLSVQVAAPPQVAAGDIAGDIDWTEDMAVPVKRRVAALRQLQSDYDALQKQFIKERAELQAKYEQQAGRQLR
eukprot:GHRR01031329.1.p2 GENE.GHRR01031329.1~~GHRR01031329.1.p2  ORF type:complete len:103 (+),score=44.40 GHRR01031329.1:436-744(+)